MARPTRRRFTSHQTSGYDLSQAQLEVTRVLDDISSQEYLYGVRLTDVALESGFENLLEHGLEREVEGFFVVDNDTGASVWRVSGSSANTKRYLPLGASSSCTIDVVVY